MSAIVPEVVDRVTALIADIDPDKLNDLEVIAFIAGMSQTASGLIASMPELKAHADLVLDLANRVFHANKTAEARGYAKAIAALRDDERYRDLAESVGGRRSEGVIRRHLADYLEALTADMAITEKTTQAGAVTA